MKLELNQNGLKIGEIGSFFAGGRIVTLSDQPEQVVQVARNAKPRTVNLNGDYITGQCYVHFVRYVKAGFDAPVMFWHGGAMTGVTWETTPDGRPGWQNYFLGRGFDTYVCDAVERGRAGWSPYPQIYDTAPIFRTQNEAWELFRFGAPGSYNTDMAKRTAFDGLQFPLDYFDRFGSQFVPRWTDHASASLEAYYNVLERVGPVWLIAHSQGGNLALEAASTHPEYFKGVVVIEPASAPEYLGQARSVPHMFIWGDYINRSPTWLQYRKSADDYAHNLQQNGGIVRILDLPANGISGNSHVPMMDENSDQIACNIAQWIAAVDAGCVV